MGESSKDEVAVSVDKVFGGKKLLLQKHSTHSSHFTDKCFPTERENLVDVIFNNVETHADPQKISLSSIAS